jgi:hypothetical protein
MSKRKRKRKTKGKGKGFSYERKICKLLSSWWTNGKRDDIYWRASQSGGRATTRLKTKKKTYGQHGDIAAIDPIGLPLLELMVVECKNGYGKDHILTLLDKPNKNKTPEFEKWINKAISCKQASGAFGWCIIHQRKGRDATIYFDWDLFKYLRNKCEGLHAVTMLKFVWMEDAQEIACISLRDFLKHVKPNDVKTLSREL